MGCLGRFLGAGSGLDATFVTLMPYEDTNTANLVVLGLARRTRSADPRSFCSDSRNLGV
jgi:hypothetical protein